jgi:hypothetical protein
MRTIILILFVFFISIIPHPTKAKVPKPPQVPQAVTMKEVRQFIDAYTARDTRMDLYVFTGLFLKGVIENRVFPYADIREAYRRTIANNRDSIIYHMKIFTVQTYARSALVRGRYEIVQNLKKGGKKKVFHGDIQWDLVRENGSLKIREVNYGRG